MNTPVKDLQRPRKLLIELDVTHKWLWALAHHRPVHVLGQLHFDLTACRCALANVSVSIHVFRVCV